jgi:hypothetical protein
MYASQCTDTMWIFLFATARAGGVIELDCVTSPPPGVSCPPTTKLLYL